MSKPTRLYYFYDPLTEYENISETPLPDHDAYVLESDAQLAAEPLIWKDSGGHAAMEESAATPFGAYFIERASEGKFALSFGNSEVCVADSILAARHVAWTDFNARLQLATGRIAQMSLRGAQLEWEGVTEGSIFDSAAMGLLFRIKKVQPASYTLQVNGDILMDGEGPKFFSSEEAAKQGAQDELDRQLRKTVRVTTPQ